MESNASSSGGMIITGLGGADPEVTAAIERGNAVVFLDVALGEGANAADLGRIKLELFVNDVSHKGAFNSVSTIRKYPLFI